MPHIPSSPPSAPSLSYPALVGLAACSSAVVCILAVYLFTQYVRNIRDKRCRISDSEKSVEVSESCHVIDISRKTVAATALAAARANLPITLQVGVPSKAPPVCVSMVLANLAPRCHLKQPNEYEAPAPFTTTRRRNLPGPSPLRTVVSAQDIQRDAAAAALVAARIDLPITLKVGVPFIAPTVDVPRVLANLAPRCHLRQLNEYEVPARFGTHRMRTRPGPSPLSTITNAVSFPPPGSRGSVLAPSRLANTSRSPAKSSAPKPSRPPPRRFNGAKENGRLFQFPLPTRVII
ncbi:hypothetical protein MVEN_02279700 [Mycena venus]|uniref:Uncharacterized protein n=1 Tax=Mycena venus TaxID=2733690 RepID=A0A8H6X4V0_9AGAR|nr:hypothetical protein MVEN_02279700 [Mycena venus]